MSTLVSPNTFIDGQSTLVEHQIFKSLAEIFKESQHTYAGHRRNIALLKKIQSKAKSQGLEDVFNFMFCKITTKILPLKKSQIGGDRVVKLIAGFIASWERHVTKMNAETQNDINEESSAFSIFLNKFMRYTLRGIESKDRNVRYRVTQLIAVIMDNISEIDEDLFDILSWAVFKRVYDKDPNVRIQAIFSVTKFQQDDAQGDENLIDEEELQQEEREEEQEEQETGTTNTDSTNATKILVKLMRNDSSPEVRRACMLNLVQTEQTLPYILERVRDSNAINRRLVYSRILRNMTNVFQVIEKSVLDKLIDWGLNDREETVRNACIKLVTIHWLNFVNGDLVDLLTKMDVMKSEVAAKIIEKLFETRSEVIEKIKFPKEIWGCFTPEVAFLLKCLFNYCHAKKLDSIIDENYLDTVEFVSILSKYVSKGLSKTAPDFLFISQQLLEIAKNYDYSDEVGRRDMLNLIRNLLYAKTLNEPCVKLCVGVLHTLAISEKDFIMIVLEIIQDLRDESFDNQEQARLKNMKKRKRIEEANGDDSSLIADEEDDELPDEEEDDNSAIESFAAAVDDLVENGQEGPSVKDAEKPALLDEDALDGKILIKCLTVSRYMLELVSEQTESIIFSSLIETVITPAVRNSDSDIRNLGLRNLGLCCLLDIDLAAENMYILGMCASKGNSSLKEIALQIIVDVFSTHGTKVVDGEGKVDLVAVHKIFYKILKNTDLPECQSIAAEGLCKLFLGNVILDDDLFETLILSYFSPANQENEPLIQAFAFCLPVYCFSHPEHQEKMCSIATDVLFRLAMLWTDLKAGDGSSDSMLKPNVIFQQLIHWTDPAQVVGQTSDAFLSANYQLEFLRNLLQIYDRFERKEVKKMILTNINRFFVCKEKSISLMQDIRVKVCAILEGNLTDTVTLNSLKKFLANLEICIEENKLANEVLDKVNPVLTEKTEEINLAEHSAEQHESRKINIGQDESMTLLLIDNHAILQEAENLEDPKSLDSTKLPQPSSGGKSVGFILPDLSDNEKDASSMNDSSYDE
ncbi:hypothetical protein ACO0QE_000646 [Hanseniaspora vineae]